jgi:uncharacterized protein affecting Mg2+/Co2+ transport
MNVQCNIYVCHLIRFCLNAEKEIKVMVPCNNANLIFEYKREQDNQMAAYLVIEKNNQVIPFKFMTHTIQIRSKDGQVTTEVTQSGLHHLVKVLSGYLFCFDADLHVKKLHGYYDKDVNNSYNEIRKEHPLGFYSTENNSDHQNNGYQKSSW